jgi:predicted GNAT family N-acyltransferase
MSDVVAIEEPPTIAEYIELRALMGWGTVSAETARISIERGIFSVCLRQQGRLVGLARVAGDGVLYFAISDVMVHPELQGGGHGATLMKAVAAYLKRAARPGATITLQPLKGREPFYERFGFARCPNETFGAGMYFTAMPSPEL